MMALVGIEPVPSRTAAERTDRSTIDARMTWGIDCQFLLITISGPAACVSVLLIVNHLVSVFDTQAKCLATFGPLCIFKPS